MCNPTAARGKPHDEMRRSSWLPGREQKVKKAGARPALRNGSCAFTRRRGLARFAISMALNKTGGAAPMRAKVVRRRKGGTFVPALTEPRVYRRGSGPGAESLWIRGLYGSRHKAHPP